MKIELRHGAGGEDTERLIKEYFAEAFQNEYLEQMEDGAVLPVMQGNPVFTSDSFVVDPVEFPGGDIGRLAVCGTVNDLASMGAKPLYLTAAFILETGLDSELLQRVINSMALTAKEAEVKIVAGDTKVVQGQGGLYINTAGIGERAVDVHISAGNLKIGDKLIVTGTLGDHHAVIMTQRLNIAAEVVSDCAPLNGIVESLLAAGLPIHTLRDITRGGLATVANELAGASRVCLELQEENLQMKQSVAGLCGILGLEPLYMGNEGKMLVAVPAEAAEEALAVIRQNKYGKEAAVVGEVVEGTGVYLHTRLGGRRKIMPLRGEGLPRIC